ncbi:MAG: thiamine-phosphate kinase [Geobacteraceae bacterium]|nr:thiamine-phosphate kinase [Geobacteraceae bacterium]
MKNNNLVDLGEFGLISRIANAARSGRGVVTGIGDDAAVTALTSGMQLLTSTDMLLEDVHFRRCWHDPYRLGRKSLAINISDIAAMGGIPRWATLSLAIPADMPLDFLDEFTRGFLAMAGEHGVALIGGDTCSSKQGLVISVTIIGEQLPELILRRSGARPGDEIWVTGTLGDAAMGLKLVERGEGEEYLLNRLLDPIPRTTAGIVLAGSGQVTAMIDVSDGILGDFGHIAELSGVGGIIRLADLPLSPQFRAAAAGLPAFPHALALSGGEDYELCFTAHPDGREKIIALMKKCGIEAAPVGIVTSSPEVAVLDANGQPFHQSHQGFNHFVS